MNEDIETDEVQPEIKSEDFMDFVNGEYDIETLELMQSVISGRVRTVSYTHLTLPTIYSV